MASGIFDSVFRLGPLAISPHFFLESFAYLAGFAIYRREHQRAGDFLPTPDHTSLLVAAIIGAAVGSKLLAGFDDPASVNLLQSVESASCKLPGSFPSCAISAAWARRKPPKAC